MLTKRVIACLDVKDGRIVKGVRFNGLRDAGDPADRAAMYQNNGADEIVVLDVSATTQTRAHAVDTLRRVREHLAIPLTVGGGIREVADASRLLDAGADKIAVNSAGVERPALLGELAEQFGRQCVVAAIDAARSACGGGWHVVTRSGTRRTGLDAVAWAAEAASIGAGEILLTSWDRDGTRSGYDLELIRSVAHTVGVPVIASGGASTSEHCAEALRAGADAVLAASIFHDDSLSSWTLKRNLAKHGLTVRLEDAS